MKKVILLLLFFIFISACTDNGEVTEHKYLFTGEGEYWSAELEYEAEEVWDKDADDVNTYANESGYIFTLTYKGDLEELAPMEQLEYQYEKGTVGSGSSSFTFDEPVSDKKFTSRGGGSGAVMRGDMVVYVDVKWDEQEESFELIVKD
jgi:hypothetical protein